METLIPKTYVFNGGKENFSYQFPDQGRHSLYMSKHYDPNKYL